MPILARWVAELQADLATERAVNDMSANRITVLEHQVSGFAYWMRVGRTPAVIRELAAAVTT